MRLAMTANQMRGARADAVMFSAGAKRRDHRRVMRQAEIIVAAEGDEFFAVDIDANSVLRVYHWPPAHKHLRRARGERSGTFSLRARRIRHDYGPLAAEGKYRMDLRVFADTILAWAWPRTCLLCALPIARGDFCATCDSDLPSLGHACRQCAAPLAAGAGLICGRCQRRPPPFVRTLAPYRYRAPLAPLVQALKYRHDLVVARALGALLAQHIVHHGTRAQLIVPVPLHRHRLQSRGYNQALELARPLARQLQLPLMPLALRRVRATRPQTELAGKERARNMRRAFVASSAVVGQHIAVVDDVMTSGHTAAAAAQALLHAGAREVEVWVLARA